MTLEGEPEQAPPGCFPDGPAPAGWDSLSEVLLFPGSAKLVIDRSERRA